jgi:hypothetical protein
MSCRLLGILSRQGFPTLQSGDRDSRPQDIPIHIMVMNVKRAGRRGEHKRSEAVKIEQKGGCADVAFWHSLREEKTRKRLANTRFCASWVAARWAWYLKRAIRSSAASSP